VSAPRRGGLLLGGTLAPPTESAPASLTIAIARCLVGPIRVADATAVVTVAGSIVDGRHGPAISGGGAGTGPAIAIEGSTVIGPASVEVLRAIGSLFTGAVQARRLQESVLRFSAVPYASRALPRHRSVLFAAPPDAPEGDTIPGEPRLASTDPGQPEYGRLADDCPEEILAGAADGGQIGAFHDAHEELRRAALAAVLDDALPHDQSPTFIFLE
jgi:hypothetical protein